MMDCRFRPEYRRSRSDAFLETSRHIRSYNKADGILPPTNTSNFNTRANTSQSNSKATSAVPGRSRNGYYSKSLPDTKKKAMAEPVKRGISTAPNRLEKKTSLPLPQINNLVKGPYVKDSTHMNGYVPQLMKRYGTSQVKPTRPPAQEQRRSERTREFQKPSYSPTVHMKGSLLPPNFATKWANARADYSGRQPNGQDVKTATSREKLPDPVKSRENTMYAINMVRASQENQSKVVASTTGQKATRTPREAENEAALKWKTIDGTEVRREKPVVEKPTVKLDMLERIKERSIEPGERKSKRLGERSNERMRERSYEVTLKKPVVRITYKTKPKVRVTNRDRPPSATKLRAPSQSEARGPSTTRSRQAPTPRTIRINKERTPSVTKLRAPSQAKVRGPSRMRSRQAATPAAYLRPSSALDMTPSWPPVMPPRPGAKKVVKRKEPLGKPAVNSQKVINKIYMNPMVPLRQKRKSKPVGFTKPKPPKLPKKPGQVVLSSAAAGKYISMRNMYDTGKALKTREKRFYEKLEKYQLESMKRHNQNIVEKQIRKMEQKQRQQMQLYRIRRRFTEEQIKRWSTQYVTGKILEHEKKDRFIYGLPEGLNEEPEKQVKLKRKRLEPKAKFSQVAHRLKNTAKYSNMFRIRLGPESVRAKTPLMEGIDFVQIVETDEKGNEVDTHVDVKNYIEDTKKLIEGSNRDLDLDASQLLGASLRESRISLDSLDLDTEEDVFERARKRYGLDNVSQLSVQVE